MNCRQPGALTTSVEFAYAAAPVTGREKTGTRCEVDLVDLDGILIDSDTGVILEVPEGADANSLIAHRFADAKGQAKAWGDVAGIYQRSLLRGQDEKRAVYGDVVITTVHGSQTVFDRDRFRAEGEVWELTSEEWRELALAATGFDGKAMQSPHLAALIGDLHFVREKAPYCLAAPVKKIAPNPSYRTVEEPDGE